MTETVAVEARSVSKLFGQGEHTVKALDGVSVKVRKGEFFTLLGPSGCGKTTLLRMIAGFESPTSGAILLDGQDITDQPPNKRPVNTVFQSYALFPHLTVAQNVAFGLQMLGRPAPDIRKRTADMLDLVKLDSMAGRTTSQLSGGQQQRVALARALAPQPKVLLLDEPLSALDLKLRKNMQIELKRLQLETGITFVFVTHDQEEALTMSDRIGVMSGGHILQVGAPREIYTAPANRFVASFIGETNFLTGRMRGGQVILDGGGTVNPGPQTRTHPEGSSVTVAIRPEQVRVVPADTPGCLHATVTGSVYLGTDTHCHLALGASEVVARIQSSAMADAATDTGARVGLAFAPGAVQVLGD